MEYVRLTAGQAIVRFLEAQKIEFFEHGEMRAVPFFGGAWAIFGHGNVAGIGEALYERRESFPTYRGHNEQSMAFAAIAFAKANKRQRAMVCTTSIGPGATNMVTAAALAHVNRLPTLFLPGDVYASRAPDPVLQQIEDFSDATISANDAFKSVSRWFDRIQRPEQLLSALPKAMTILTDPVMCGPVTLSVCQDVQAEAFDFQKVFFEEKTWRIRKPEPDARDIQTLVELLMSAKKPFFIVGGGVHYSNAAHIVQAFIEKYNIPFGETQAGKGAIVSDCAQNMGGLGVTGTKAANECVQNADLVVALGTRLQDFTTGSRALFTRTDGNVVQVNINPLDAAKHFCTPIVGDVGAVVNLLDQKMGVYQPAEDWAFEYKAAKKRWLQASSSIKEGSKVSGLPNDAEVLGALERVLGKETGQHTIVAAAGGLPGELHSLWNTKQPESYHVEYGYSCMGYEIAGALGVKMARQDQHVISLVGDGSYLMLNSEIATSVMLDKKLIILVLNNGGFGCINRLQNSVGCPSFNNLLDDCYFERLEPVCFEAHAASLGALSEKVATVYELEEALERAFRAEKTYVVVIDTDPSPILIDRGHWWDVAVPEVSSIEPVRKAFKAYQINKKNQQSIG